jgi:hypothetical protein
VKDERLTVADAGIVDSLETIAKQLMTVADGCEDVNQFMAYRSASLGVEQEAVQLRQALAAARVTPIFKAEGRPWYNAGRRAFESTFEGRKRG